MNSLIKLFKTVITMLVLVPIAYFTLCFGGDVLAQAVNHAAGAVQTSQIIHGFHEGGVEVLDSKTFVGDISGAGECVDLESLLLVRSEGNSEMLKDCFITRDYSYIAPCQPDASVKAAYMDRLDFPQELEGLFVVRVISKAPFSEKP